MSDKADEFLTALDARRDATLNDCTSCGKCVEVCPMPGPAGIDAGDPAAVRKFAEANKGLLQDATNKALIAAVGGKLSKSAAGHLSKLIGGNEFVGDGVEAGIKKMIDAGFGKIRRNK